ncbi:MAG: tripartite tricarboxylate transporter substrate binding protein [Xanthobacteraceae bacterium]|nr:tripartite tricarboxylate transporter substrate binding protein [Xanthobacteraceae bacterium]
MIRRAAAALAALLVLPLFALPLTAQAQGQYPSQPIKLIVPYAAGGLPDTTARIVGVRLQEKIGQSVVVENRPGGAGSVAVNALNTAPADGYTLMVTDGATVTINPALFKSLSYTARDVPGVALLGRAPLFLVAHADVPANSLKEFVAYVKANPGKVNYGSSGVGSAHHLSMEAMKAALGLDMTHVPYRGTGQSVPALLGGHVPVIFSAYPSLAAAIADKRVKLLATNGAQPSPQAPDVPPLASVIPGFDLATMVGIFARAGTPSAITDKIAAEAIAVVKMPETQKQLAAAGIEPAGEGTAAFRKYLAAEADYVGKLIATAGIKVE